MSTFPPIDPPVRCTECSRQRFDETDLLSDPAPVLGENSYSHVATASDNTTVLLSALLFRHYYIQCIYLIVNVLQIIPHNNCKDNHVNKC